jgi:hypothetical protein
MSTDSDQRRFTAEGPSTMPLRQGPEPVGRGTRRSLLGTVFGIIGGALIAIATFLPWLEFNGGLRSGWDIFSISRTLGTNPAVISPMFGGGAFDIFFTGIVTLALGFLSMLLIAAVLVANRKPPPEKATARLVLVVSATLAIAVALVITVVNLRTARFGPQESGQAVAHFGLWVAFVGGWAGTLGMAVSNSGKGWRSQQRREREVAEAAAGQQIWDTLLLMGRPGRTSPSPSTGTSSPGTPSGSSPTAPPPATSPPPVTSSPIAAAPSAQVRHPARTFAILFLLIGLGGYVAAAGADNSHSQTAAVDDKALGQRDPVVVTEALTSRVTPLKVAYDEYAADSLAVARAREKVTILLNDAASSSGAESLGAAQAQEELPAAIAFYDAAIQRERVSGQAYTRLLPALMREMHP